MKKIIIAILSLGFTPLSQAIVEDQGIGMYQCDIRITSSQTETQMLPEAALVKDNGNNYIVKMLGNQVTSPELESVMGGVKQQATKNGITFVRRPTYDDRFIIENSKSGFFYRLRNCKKL
ncbi:MAG: hypothetical protein E6868_09975 [Pantoea sp.]|uniref:hypothetical protein n=1 Tax=Pantoea TaxID=53335 RepID=UPI0028AF96F6|nr:MULTISPECIES: hypothetical protein [Pantoea]MDU1573563.1 hypothetical protein [Pantoea sp.]